MIGNTYIDHMILIGKTKKFYIKRIILGLIVFFCSIITIIFSSCSTNILMVIIKPFEITIALFSFLYVVFITYSNPYLFLKRNRRKILKEFTIHSLKELSIIRYPETDFFELSDGEVFIPLGKGFSYKTLSYQEAIKMIENYKYI